MRRDRRPPPSNFFGSSNWLRLIAMIGALVVLGMFMYKLRDPDTHRALQGLLDPGGQAREEQADAEPDRTPHAPREEEPHAKREEYKKPQAEHDEYEEPKGPTDLDPEQREEIEREFQAITDRKLNIQREEMVPYNRIVLWSLNQTTAEMRKRARTDLTYNDFIQSPDKYRGELVEMVLDARMIVPAAGPPEYPVRLHEIWGATSESGSWLHCAIVVNFPEKMPTGRGLSERIRFVGYFFKVQGYKAALDRQKDPIELAPMFIGRMVWIQQPGQAAAERAPDQPPGFWQTPTGMAVLVGTLALLAVLAAGLPMLFRRRPKRTYGEIRAAQPGALSPDDWLDPDRLDPDGEPKDNE